MTIDKLSRYSNGQAITASAASLVLDHGAAGGNVGQNMSLVVRGGTAFNNLTSLKVSFQTSSDNFAADTTTLFEKTFTLAELTANKIQMNQPIGPGMKRYTRVYYTVTGTAPTTGTVDAFINSGARVE